MIFKMKTTVLIVLLAHPFCSMALERVELFPPKMQSYIRISNATAFEEKLQHSPMGALWRDAQFRDFLGNPDENTWQELIWEGDSRAEHDLMVEQFGMIQGEALLAFDLSNNDSYIIVEMTSADFDRSLELDDKMQEIMGASFEILKHDFQGVELVQHLEHVGTPQATSLWQAHLGNTLVMGPDREWIERCIVRLKKEEVTQPKGNPTLDLNLPLSTFFSSSSLVAGLLPAPSMLEALGLFELENLSVTLELREDELVIDGHVRVADLSRGLLALLETTPVHFPAVSFVPEGVASVEVGQVNLLQFWQEIPNVLAAAKPGLKMQLDLLVGLFRQQSGIDLEQDLLAHLGTKYIAFSLVDECQQTSVVAIDLKDSMAFEQGLETAFSAPGLQAYVAAGVNIETFLDHTLYLFKAQDPNEIPAGICVTGDYLFYGPPDALRQVIRDENNTSLDFSFENTKWMQQVRQQVSQQAFAFSAIDWGRNMSTLVRELSNPTLVGNIQQRWAMSGAVLPPPDFDKVPPASHLATFFGISYQYTEATADGLHHRMILKY